MTWEVPLCRHALLSGMFPSYGPASKELSDCSIISAMGFTTLFTAAGFRYGQAVSGHWWL